LRANNACDNSFEITEAAMSRQIVPGIRLDDFGQATINSAMGKRLISLALELEAYTSTAVDVQHVLAAIIIATNDGNLESDLALPDSEPELLRLLAKHVESVFAKTGGKVSRDE